MNKPNQRNKTNTCNKPVGLIVFVILMLFFMTYILLKNVDIKQGNIAWVKIEGTIFSSSTDSFLPISAVTSDEIIHIIDSIINNRNIKAVVFEINSPGGSAVGSSEIVEAIKKLKSANKTTVALIRETGASGAYWVASSCDYIVAHPLSITGSIGVLASYLEFAGLLDKFNITYVNLTAGEYKDTMSPFKEITQEEKKLIQDKLDMIHLEFIRDVAKNRKMEESKVKELANGMFYLGKEAKDLGLIDELGTKETVISYIEKKHNIKAQIIEYKKPRSLLERLSEIMAHQSFWVGRGIGSIFVDKTWIINSQAIVPRT